jgi:hypothetical protein
MIYDFYKKQFLMWGIINKMIYDCDQRDSAIIFETTDLHQH